MTPRRWAILGIALVCVGADLVYFESQKGEETADAGADAGESCGAIVKRYAEAVAPLQACRVDAECIAEKHDEVLSGLGGCVRARRADAGLTAVAAIEAAWKTSGCAKRFVTCEPRGARCLEGVCREAPPAGVPANWVRHEHIAHLTQQPAFSFWLPPGSTERDSVADDGEGGTWDTPHFELSYEWDEYAPSLEPNVDAGDVPLGSREESVAGVNAHLRTYRMKERVMSGVRFDPTDAVARVRPSLSLFAWCPTAEECADVWTIGRSVTFE